MSGYSFENQLFQVVQRRLACAGQMLIYRLLGDSKDFDD